MMEKGQYQSVLVWPEEKGELHAQDTDPSKCLMWGLSIRLWLFYSFVSGSGWHRMCGYSDAFIDHIHSELRFEMGASRPAPAAFT